MDIVPDITGRLRAAGRMLCAGSGQEGNLSFLEALDYPRGLESDVWADAYAEWFTLLVGPMES
jgi:hypothetical protein